jgi:hypothetical protein
MSNLFCGFLLFPNGKEEVTRKRKKAKRGKQLSLR